MNFTLDVKNINEQRFLQKLKRLYLTLNAMIRRKQEVHYVT